MSIKSHFVSLMDWNRTESLKAGYGICELLCTHVLFCQYHAWLQQCRAKKTKKNGFLEEISVKCAAPNAFFSKERQKVLVISAAMIQTLYISVNSSIEYHTLKLHKDCYFQLKQIHKHSERLTLTKVVSMPAESTVYISKR